MRRLFLVFSVFAALLLGGLSVPASACPMCKQANEAEQTEEENVRPKAYMYSILFMLAMPATIATGFGIGLYRLSRRGVADAETPVDEAPLD